MGMTDRQFDAYQKQLLNNLKRAKSDIVADNPKAETKELDIVIHDIEDSLKRP